MRKIYTTPVISASADVVRATLGSKDLAFVESTPANTRPSGGTNLSFGL